MTPPFSPVGGNAGKSPEKPLSDYQRGYLDGMWAYGWWKDGQCFVGTTGTTYKRAVEKFLGDGSTVEYEDYLNQEELA